MTHGRVVIIHKSVLYSDMSVNTQTVITMYRTLHTTALVRSVGCTETVNKECAIPYETMYTEPLRSLCACCDERLCTPNDICKRDCTDINIHAHRLSPTNVCTLHPSQHTPLTSTSSYKSNITINAQCQCSFIQYNCHLTFILMVL
jgi:hypothetical protein